MSILKQISLPGGSQSETYVRPSDWLTLPDVSVGQQKFVGLHAVFDHESNFVAVNCAGAYTVDWGDGTAVENKATGVAAYHNYVYSALGAETACSRGYRQAIVTITPQGGSNFTTVNLLVKHNQSGLVNSSTSGWLDIRMAGSLITTLTIGATSTTVAVHRMLEQFEFVGTCGITTCSAKFANCSSLQNVVSFHPGTSTVFSNMFQYCYSLQTISLLNTALGTDFSSMFQYCYSLQTIPLLNTGAGTNFSSMFYGCYSLQTIPLLNTGAGTNFSSMFYGCYSLQTIPLLNIGAGTNFSSMFAYCSLLQTIPLLNTAAGTVFASMFQSCSSLTTIPLLNTAAGQSFAFMFSGCPSLTTIPLLNTAAGVSFNTMFGGCPSLTTIPLLNTGGATAGVGNGFPNMLNGCSSLQTIPALNTGGATSFGGMFSGCSSLVAVPALNLALGTSIASMFGTCFSLRSAAITNTNISIDYSNCSLGPAALNAIYAGLAAMNLLSANAASVETNVTDWSTGPVNCAVTQSTVTGSNGTKAARLTATAAGITSAAITNRIAVSASSPHTFLATVKSSVSRSCNVNIAWYDAGGALISTDTGASVTSSTTLWTQLSISATSPVGAVTASLILSAVATAGAETHDFDKMGLFYGSGVTLWLVGGQTTPVITVTGNWGTASDTPSIATNKGWTVTG